MAQHMQQAMPAHLKQYAGGQTYIPQHAEKAMMQQMQKSMPAHMQEYIPSFMHQQVTAGQQSIRGGQPRVPQPHAPVPNPMRRDHSLGFGEQHSVQVQTSADNLTPTDQISYSPQYQQPAQPGAPAPEGQAPQQPYEFIMNPAPPPKRSLFPSGGSKMMRFAVLGGGLVILLILFSVIKSLLFAPHVSPQLLTAAQDQQAMIHLVTNALDEPALSGTNSNFAVSAKLSLTSEQYRLLTYMKKNGKKVKPKVLNQMISKSTDDQLASAAKQDSYNRVFQEVMQQKLTAYQHRLALAKADTTGKKGRALLLSEQQSAQLLQKMLETK